MSAHIDDAVAKECEVGVYSAVEFADTFGLDGPTADDFDRHVVLLGEPDGAGGFAVYGKATELRTWLRKVERELESHLQRPGSATGRATTDQEKVWSRVLRAIDEERLIEHETARVIASWWHGGQMSDSYGFVSTGAIEHPNELIAELAVAQRQTRKAHEQDDGDDDAEMLRQLGKYIQAAGPRPAIPFWSELWV